MLRKLSFGTVLGRSPKLEYSIFRVPPVYLGAEIAKMISVKGIWKAKYIQSNISTKKSLLYFRGQNIAFYCGSEVVQVVKASRFAHFFASIFENKGVLEKAMRGSLLAFRFECLRSDSKNQQGKI